MISSEVTDVAVEVVERCPVCGSDDLVPLYETRDRLHDLPGIFALVSCGECGSGVLSPRPTVSGIADYYPEDYEPYGRGAKVVQDGVLWRRVVGRLLAAIPAILPDPAASIWDDLRRVGGSGPRVVLDVGCGDGRILLEDAQAGWQTVGVDFSETAVNRARRFGLDVRLGGITEVELDPGTFDLVRMSHVIEHLVDPHAALRRAYKLLRPGGRLHVLTPNFASPSARLFGTYWWGIEAPRHLVIFTPSSLRAIAERSGFVLEREVHEVMPKDFLASLSRWARERTPSSLLTRAGDLRFAIIPRQLLYPVWWVLAHRRKGERMHFVFRKPTSGE